jgi:N-acetylmuramic acid 6-phosphate etherase
MTNVQPRNVKLRARAERILMAEADLDPETAAANLDAAGGDLRVALVMSKTGRDREAAHAALIESRWVVAEAIKALSPDAAE